MAEDERGKDLSDPRSWLLPDDEQDVDEHDADGPEPGPRDDGPATESMQMLDDEEPPLRFGPDDTGPLPHWTEPPDGRGAAHPGRRARSRRRRLVGPAGAGPGLARRPRGGAGHARRRARLRHLLRGDPRRRPRRAPAPSDPFFDLEDDEEPAPLPPPIVEPDPSRVTAIRTRQAAPTGARARLAAPTPTTRRWRTSGAPPGRDMAMAIGVGVVLAALFLLLARLGGKYLMVLVVLALAAAAVEFFDKIREQGYQPAHAGRARGRGRPAAGGLLAGRGRASRS